MNHLCFNFSDTQQHTFVVSLLNCTSRTCYGTPKPETPIDVQACFIQGQLRGAMHLYAAPATCHSMAFSGLLAP